MFNSQFDYIKSYNQKFEIAIIHSKKKKKKNSKENYTRSLLK